MNELLALLPPHKGPLTIEHNEHKACYETVLEHLQSRKAGVEDFGSPEDYAAAIAGDELWGIQWYPDTPNGFYYVFGSTLDRCLAAVSK